MEVLNKIIEQVDAVKAALVESLEVVAAELKAAHDAGVKAGLEEAGNGGLVTKQQLEEAVAAAVVPLQAELEATKAELEALKADAPKKEEKAKAEGKAELKAELKAKYAAQQVAETAGETGFLAELEEAVVVEAPVMGEVINGEAVVEA